MPAAPSHEYVILVDQHDREIGTEEKIRAHERGVLHRAFSVFVIRQGKNGWETLLQQRHNDKYHCAELWTNSVCSHPRQDEILKEAAERRLQEELGLSLSLQHIGEFTYRAELKNGLIEHEYDHVFVGEYQNQALAPHPKEIMDTRWISIEALLADLEANPKTYTPWLKQALQILISAQK